MIPEGRLFTFATKSAAISGLPCRFPPGAPRPYVTRHGFGYSVFEHVERGISSETWVYVDIDQPVKFTVLKVRNRSGRSRRLSATGYVEWVLGDVRPKSVMHVVTEIDPQTGALLARNPYNTEFGNRVAFFNVDNTARTVSGDRTEFLGRNGDLSHPAAMDRSRLIRQGRGRTRSMRRDTSGLRSRRRGRTGDRLHPRLGAECR